MSLDRIFHYQVMLEGIKSLIKNPISLSIHFWWWWIFKRFLKYFQNCKVIAFDRDKSSEMRAQKIANTNKSRFKFYNSKFSKIENL